MTKKIKQYERLVHKYYDFENDHGVKSTHSGKLVQD